MEKLILPSEEVYPFLFETDKIDPRSVLILLAKRFSQRDDIENLSIDELQILAGKYNFLEVPPIPVFSLPEEFQKNGWKYVLPDGNKRWLYGHITAQKVSAILFLPDEKIDPENSWVAPFRHMHHENIYSKTLKIYAHQQWIS